MSRHRARGAPPRVAEWLLERILARGKTRESVLGDLAEEWGAIGSDRSTAWYWRHAALIGARFFWQRLTARSSSPHLTARKGDGPMQSIAQDLRYSLRTLAGKPGFAVAAVTTLTLGIGVNTTIFSLINGLLLRMPAGIEQPDRLVQIGRGADAHDFDNYSYPVFLDIRDRNRSFSGVAAFTRRGMILGRGSETELVAGQVVSGSYFEVLGVGPVLGRGFLPEEVEAPGGAFVAVISERLWKRRFGSDPDILDHPITLNSRQFRVVGVTPSGFAGTDIVQRAPEVWVPVTASEPILGDLEERLATRDWSWLWVVARRKPGVVLNQAAADMRGLVAQLDEEHPALAGQGVQVVAGVGLDPSARFQAAGVVALLAVVAALVLLIACANLANMLLVRATGRSQEIGIRLTLGASRGRIVRQLLVESLVLSSAGAVVAFALTRWSAQVLPRLVPYPLAVDLAPDLRVFGFALAIALAAGMLFGLAPAWRSVREDFSTLRGATSTPAAHGSRLRHALVVGQLAVAFVLLVAAGLLVRSLREGQAADPGFHTDDVLVMSLPIELRGTYAEENGSLWYEELLARVGSLPGTVAAGLGESLPIADFPSNRTVRIEGESEPKGRLAFYNVVSSGYFEALGLTVLRGRAFDDAVDRPGSPPVIVINETMAERFWPGEDPIGKRIAYGDTVAEVIGVARDARMRSLRGSVRPYMFVPFRQSYSGRMILHVRTSGDPHMAAPAIAKQVQALDAGLPIYRVGTLREEINKALGETRSTATLIGVFGLLAAALAAIGLYSVVAYAVARRTREMGLRMALGARPADVMRAVLGRGLVLTALGLILGLAGALGTTKWIAGLLYQVSPGDPATLIGIGLAFAVVGLGASYFPARRATRVDPVVALREP